MKSFAAPINARNVHLVVLKEVASVVEGNGDRPARYRRAVLCQCDCGNTPVVILEKFLSGYAKSCGCRTGMSLQDLFWSKVDRSGGPLVCWPWLGAYHSKGRGRSGTYGDFFQRRDPRIPRIAHRAAWYFTHGPIPEGLLLLHDCDNPPCCNPSHLHPGTNLDNMADRDLKGRQARGERQGLSRLTAAKVRTIRRLSAQGKTGTAIAKKLGVLRGVVYHVLSGYTWTHV
jgi:hypothetical protein